MDDLEIGGDEDDEGGEELCDKDNYTILAVKDLERFFSNHDSYSGKRYSAAGTTLIWCTSDEVDILYIDDNIRPGNIFMSSEVISVSHLFVEVISTLTARVETCDKKVLRNSEVGESVSTICTVFYLHWSPYAVHAKIAQSRNVSLPRTDSVMRCPPR